MTNVPSIEIDASDNENNMNNDGNNNNNNSNIMTLKKDSNASNNDYIRSNDRERRKSLVESIASKMRSKLPGSDDPSNQYEFSHWELETTNKDLSNEHKLEPAFVKMAPQKRLLDDFNTLWKRAYFALIILALCIALLTFGVSQAATFAWEQQAKLYKDPSHPYTEWIPSYILELTIKILLVVGAIGATSLFQPSAAGSGVPELRAILSGIWIKEYLGIRTFVVKIIALVFSLSSGLPIGLEGPFIHLSAILGRQLTKLSFFRHLDRKQVLSAACAGGLASVFGAPIGGVLFSIEVTSTYYAVTNYWTAFCCAVAGSTLTHVFGTLSTTSLLFYQTNFNEESSDADVYVTYELFLFAMVGLFCGIIGSIFINGHEWYVNFRRKYQARILGTNPYGVAILVVTLFVSTTFFVGDFAIQPARRAVSDMFTILELQDCSQSGSDSYDECEYQDWGDRSLIVNLSLFCSLNIFFAIMSTTLAYPCGVFAPVFTIGAVFGRLSGELARDYVSDTVDPRVYAVVGAAGVAAGVTQTISPAVIALEITQELNLSVPLLLCVIVSCGMSSGISTSFYNSILRLRGIPMLPIRPSEPYKRVTVRKRANSSLNPNIGGDLLSPTERDGASGQEMSFTNKVTTDRSINSRNNIVTETMYRLLIADDVMEKEFLFVTIEPTPEQLIELLTDETHSNEWFPVVHSRSEAVLVGEVRRVVLLDYLRVIAPDIYEEELPAEIRAGHMSNYNESNNTIRDKASLMDPSLLSSMNVTNPTTLRQIATHKSSMNIDNNNNKAKKHRKRVPNTLETPHFGGRNDYTLQTESKPVGALRDIRENSGNMSYEQDGKESGSRDERNNSNSSSSDESESDVLNVSGIINGDKRETREATPVKWTLMSTGFIERLNLSPIQVISEMPLTKIYTLFHILKPQNIYVTKYSRLIGVINELHLLHREIETQPHISQKRVCMCCNKNKNN